MNNVTLFDFCIEICVPVVKYSANHETINRWIRKGENIVVLGASKISLSCPPQYVYCEPNGTEHSAVINDGRLIYSTIDFKSLDINIIFLISKLYTDLKIRDYTLYFYVVNDRTFISGINENGTR